MRPSLRLRLVLALGLAAAALGAAAPPPFAPTVALPGWYLALWAAAAAAPAPTPAARAALAAAARSLPADPVPDVRAARLVRIRVAKRKDRPATSGLFWLLPSTVRAEPAVPADAPAGVRLLGSFLETADLDEAFAYPATLGGKPFWDVAAGLLARPDLAAGPLPPGTTVTPVTFAAAADALLHAAPVHGLHGAPPDWAERVRHDGIELGEADQVLLWASIAAAELDDRDRAAALLSAALVTAADALVRLAEDRAWRLYNRGVTALYQAGQAAAVAPLDSAARLYPETRSGADARALADACRRAAVPPAPPPADPGRRAVEALLELHTLQTMDPGGPVLFAGLFPSGPPQPTDAAVALGPDVIPAMIDALADERPTRAIHWHRRFFTGRSVVRVSGAALAVIEMIVGAPFYTRTCTGCFLESEEPATRDRAIAAARAFWEHHRDGAGALAWVVPRLTRACDADIFGKDRTRACIALGDSTAGRAAVARWAVRTLGYEAMRATFRDIAARGAFLWVPGVAGAMIDAGDRAPAVAALHALLRSKTTYGVARTEAADALRAAGEPVP